MLFRQRVTVGALLTAVSLATLMLPASADPYLDTFYNPPTNYADQGTYDPGCKGVDMKVHFRVKGTYWDLNVPGSGGNAFLHTDNYVFKDRWVNTKTGKWMTVEGTHNFQEVSATRVNKSDVPADLIPDGGLVGPIYLFESVDSGNPSQLVTSSSGRTVLKDVGVLYFEQLFDTLGDHAPGGESLKFDIVKVDGHPGQNRDFCRIAKRVTS